MEVNQFLLHSRRSEYFRLTGLLLLLVAFVVLWPQNLAGQHPAVPKLTLAQVEELVSHKVPDSTLSTQIQKRGLAFAPNPAILESLRAKGAGPLTLAAVEELFAKGTQSLGSARTRRTLGSGFKEPFGVAVDRSGNIFVADTGNNTVKEIPAGGGYTAVKVLSGGYPFGVAADRNGNIFVADTFNNAVKEILAADGYASTIALGGRFQMPHGVAVDSYGNVFVAEYGDGSPEGRGSSVKEILVTGGYSIVNTLGGSFNHPMGVAVDGSGNVFVADAGNNNVKEIPSGCTSASCVETLGGSFGHPVGVAVDRSGNVFVADSNDNTVKEIVSAGGYTKIITLDTELRTPMGVAVDGSGNVFIADRGNDRVVELEIAGPNSAPSAATNRASLTPFFGAWNKVDFGGYVKVIISGSPEKPRVHLWGSCSPRNCDDGEVDAHWDRSALTATFMQDFPTVYRFTLDQNADLQLGCHYVRPNGVEGSCVNMSYTKSSGLDVGGDDTPQIPH